MNFKDELNNISKTPEEIEKCIDAEAMEYACLKAKSDYDKIKDAISDMARNGQYTLAPDGRCITYYHSLSKFDYLDIKDKILPTRIKRGFKTATVHLPYLVVKIQSDKQKEYDYYIQKLNDLGKNDGVIIEVVFRNYRTKKEYPIPITLDSSDGVFPGQYEFMLKCTIKY